MLRRSELIFVHKRGEFRMRIGKFFQFVQKFVESGAFFFASRFTGFSFDNASESAAFLSAGI